jgi:anthranilate synthase component 1
MLYPALEEFRRLSKRGNIVPVYREILADTDTPVTAFLKLGTTPSFLLESVEGGETWARYSFISAQSHKIIRGRGRSIEIMTDKYHRQTIESENPFDVIRNELKAYKPVAVEGLPRFYGGLVGFVGYDMVRCFEEIPDGNKKGIDMPDVFFMLTDTILIFDNLKQKIKIVSSVFIENTEEVAAYRAAEKKIEQVIAKLKTPLMVHDTEQSVEPGTFCANVSKATFLSSVEKSKDHVMAGDVVQVVLSQRFERSTTVRPFDIYRALRVINPSPYMYYIDIGNAQIVGSSPEILVRLEEGRIVLRPIAGTRKRGRDAVADRVLERELREDPKEIAEHIMLVDLGRNDVGRVAKTGSVTVTEMMAVERYSHVMHLVSNVEGDLREGLDSFDVLAACFPAGTVTGAPKVRAMEIIEELELIRRGPYAGAVGYFSFTGNMDTCITIRTLIIKDGTVYVQAGAGIVADSVPEKEYYETINKAKGMMKAVDMAEKGLC